MREACHVPVAQLADAADLGSVICGFDFHREHLYAGLVLLVEPRFCTPARRDRSLHPAPFFVPKIKYRKD